MVLFRTPKVEICVDLTTFEADGYGFICLKLGNEYFPDKRWGDFPVVLLGWWLGKFVRLVTRKSKHAKCSFMDGPFMFEANRIADKPGWIRIACIRHTATKPVVELTYECELPAFVKQLVAAGQRVAVYCRKKRVAKDVAPLLDGIEHAEKWLARSRKPSTDQN